MDLETTWVTHDVPGGSVSAYLARPKPATGPVPGIIVIQEIWGVDEHIQDLVERFATAGYAAIAPDLYSAPAGRPPQLSVERVQAAKQFLNSIPPSEWMSVLGDPERRAQELAKLPGDQGVQIGETIGTLFGGMGRDTGKYLDVLRSTFSYLRSNPACSERAVGSIGYCMGGGLSALLASVERELGAAAIFYGGSPSAEQTASIGCPVRGFYGADDPRIVSGLPDFAEALSKAGVDHELRVYPDTGHAFFNDGRPSYRHVAARDAWARTLAFFAATLDPVTTA
ncbi:MAG: dienelactone hydrolase family protein [Solirubrobacteraceae bacterium]